MNERNAPRVYGLRVGLVSGLFSIGQVLLSVAAAHGAEAALRAMQRAFAILASGGIADPTTLISGLVPMLLTTYLSMLVIGLLTIWFAGRAGRLAAIAQGRRAGGASAGMWVWLIGTLIWLLASVIAAVITHSDGTLSGVFVGTFSDAYLPQQVIFLLLQEILAALICLGFCALAGSQGARNAPVSPPSDGALMPLRGTAGYPPQGAYPYAPYAPYPMPSYPGYPPHPGYPAPQQPYPGYPTYPGYPAYPGYPGYPPGWQGAPVPPAPGVSPSPPVAPPAQPPTNAPQAAAPLQYPPSPSFYVPQPPAQAEPPTATPAPEPQLE
jgi:hypothetical protein